MRKFWNGVLIFCLITGCIVCGATASAAVWLGTHFDSELPEEYLELAETNLPSYLYASTNGDRNDLSSFTVVTELKGSAFCIPAAIGEMPKDLINAFIAVEDKRFYTHHGVDWLRTAEAVAGYLFGSGDFGASTITQQLVKNLTGNDAHTPMRKLQELFYATDLEKKTDKTEIMERYLNIINLSGGCSGVGAAAMRYYSKPVSELTLSECAVIAAITKNPSRYDPIRHPENNLMRRDVILDEMYRQGYISKEACDAAKSEDLGLCPTALAGNEPVNSWYTDTVIEDVLADLMETYGYSSATASRMLYYGGLRIYTAEDPELQQLVEAFYADDTNFPACSDGRIPQSSLVLIHPETGDLLAIAGAHGQKTANRICNLAAQTKRPPASALKPLSVYAPALKSGKITWASVYDDVPVDFLQNEDSYRPWPKNADKLWHGLTGIPEAVAQSVNTVAVRILRDIGKETSVDFLTNQLGLPGFSEDDGEAALALGQTAYGVTLRDLTAAYTIFTDEGYCHRCRSYYLVTDAEGNVLLSNSDTPRAVLSAEEAAIMTKLLEGVTKEGTAKSLTLTARTAVAGKTGTSSSDFDRWLIGYTPDFLCGVWYGFPYPERQVGISGNPAVTVWDRLMNRVYDSFPDKITATSFDTLSTLLKLSYCADSGEVVSAACGSDPRGVRVREGWFVPGTEPEHICQVHTYVGIHPETGGVTKDGSGKQVALLNICRSFPMKLYVSDAQYTTRELPQGTPFCTDPGLPFFAYALREGEFAGIGYGGKQYNRGSLPCDPDPETVTEPPEPEDSETDEPESVSPEPSSPPHSAPESPMPNRAPADRKPIDSRSPRRRGTGFPFFRKRSDA